MTVRTKRGCPYLRGVVLEGQAVIRTFQYLASGTDSEADQVQAVANSFATAMVGLPAKPSAVVVREADDAVRGGLTAARKTRLRCEGAVLHEARRLTTAVTVMNGPQIGRACGGSLSDAEEQAKSIANVVDDVPSTSAALAARSISAS